MPTSKCHLLSLPPEILQMIYLHSLSPNFPHASPLLGAILSAPHIYRLTFFHVFWNRDPFRFIYLLREQLPFEPSPHLRTLFYPLSGPFSVFRPQEKGVTATIKLQESVMRCRWFTFDNARRWLGEIVLAVIKDLLNSYRSNFDFTHLDCFMAKSPTSLATFVTSTWDGSKLTLKSSGPFSTALSLNYCDQFPHGAQYDLTLAPTNFVVLPPHLLKGEPEWTMEKVDSLQLFSSYVNLDAVKCQRAAFHEGMRNAVIQRHYDALLTFVWLGTRLAESRQSIYLTAADYDENPLKPPPELFRLVAKQGMRSFAAPSDRRSGHQVKNDEAEISLWLFTLLLRAHAESMPQNDPDIQAWANHLSTRQDSDDTVHGLARWIADWESSYEKPKPGVYRDPLFRAGRVSTDRKNDKMAIRFEESLGEKVQGFEEQLEKRMQSRDGGREDKGGLTLVV